MSEDTEQAEKDEEKDEEKGEDQEDEKSELEKEEEAAEAEVAKMEDDPPMDLQEWPDGDAKYKTFGGPDADTGYEEGPTAKLGPADVRHHEDGSVSVQGEMVDNPEDYKGEPIPGGPTDPDTAGLAGDKADPEDASTYDENEDDSSEGSDDDEERDESQDEDSGDEDRSESRDEDRNEDSGDEESDDD
jgi:hypothetical protein